MRRPGGYVTITSPDDLVEFDTTMCQHCQRHILVKPGHGNTVYLIPLPNGQYVEEPGAWCGRCHGPICLPCHENGTCLPWEKYLEKIEAKAASRRSLGI
jgi:hypothetical protein